MATRGGARGTRVPPFFLDQTEARRAEKSFFGDRFPPLSKGLDDRAPPLSQGMDPARQFGETHPDLSVSYLPKILNLKTDMTSK